MATTDHSHHGSHGHHHGHGHEVVLNHETTDVNLTGITRIAILTFVIIFAVLGLVYGFWGIFADFAADPRQLSPMSGRKAGEDRLPVGPLVLTDEPGALRQLRTKERDALHHYGWVDKNQGIVRIPIERAIELMSQQPNRINPDGSAPAAPAAPGAPAAAPAAASSAPAAQPAH